MLSTRGSVVLSVSVLVLGSLSCLSRLSASVVPLVIHLQPSTPVGQFQ